MTNFKKQLLSVIATGAVLLSTASPVFASTTIQIVGNGTESNNTANVSTSNNVTVQQSNNAIVTNNVESNADSGNNKANENTGGNVSIETGSATSNTDVSNSLNTNVANVDCACGNGDTSVLIKKNGADSDNTVNLGQNKEDGTQVIQQNLAIVSNNVDAYANSGKNKADENTGGNVSIETGAAKATTSVSTTANANVANVGGAGNGGSLSAVIYGNGADSDNTINLETSNDVTIWQANDAIVTNNVDSYAKSGGNKADENTGGNVSIETGRAESDVTVDNSVNFNSANVGCDCLTDVTAAIDGNGEDSDNTINAEIGGDLGVFQGGECLGNNAILDNNVDSGAKSGKNYANENTGSVYGGDPSIETGSATSSTEVNNSGNENIYGTPFEFPGVHNVNFSFNFAALWAFFGISSN